MGEGSNSDFGKKAQTLIPTKCSLKLTSSKKCFYTQSVCHVWWTVGIPMGTSCAPLLIAFIHMKQTLCRNF